MAKITIKETRERTKLSRESNLVDRVIGYINRDIETNKKMNGIDFSNFLGVIADFCLSNRSPDFIFDPVRTNNKSYAIGLALDTAYVAMKMSEKYGKTIDFSQTCEGLLNIHMFNEEDMFSLYDYTHELALKEANLSENEEIIHEFCKHKLNSAYGED